jgi:hypothetical protein
MHNRSSVLTRWGAGAADADFACARRRLATLHRLSPIRSVWVVHRCHISSYARRAVSNLTHKTVKRVVERAEAGEVARKQVAKSRGRSSAKWSLPMGRVAGYDRLGSQSRQTSGRT